jgi:hypothetical protein
MVISFGGRVKEAFLHTGTDRKVSERNKIKNNH